MHYAIALFGSLLWNFGIFQIAKNKCDTEGVDFDYRKYVKLSWDDWAWTVLASLPLVWYMREILDIINYASGASIPFFEPYYLGAGVVSQLLTFGIKWILGKIGMIKIPSIIPQVHKD